MCVSVSPCLPPVNTRRVGLGLLLCARVSGWQIDSWGVLGGVLVFVCQLCANVLSVCAPGSDHAVEAWVLCELVFGLIS